VVGSVDSKLAEAAAASALSTVIARMGGYVHHYYTIRISKRDSDYSDYDDDDVTSNRDKLCLYVAGKYLDSATLAKVLNGKCACRLYVARAKFTPRGSGKQLMLELGLAITMEEAEEEYSWRERITAWAEIEYPVDYRGKPMKIAWAALEEFNRRIVVLSYT